jgi:hypothetical protein
MTRPLWTAYLVFSLATLLACTILAAHTVLRAPFHNYTIIITTNDHGEGIPEAIGILVSIPGWLYLSLHLIKTITPEMAKHQERGAP